MSKILKRILLSEAFTEFMAKEAAKKTVFYVGSIMLLLTAAAAMFAF